MQTKIKQRLKQLGDKRYSLLSHQRCFNDILNNNINAKVKYYIHISITVLYPLTLLRAIKDN